ncbi:MAG: GNAT family N-acetyltransferase [Gammaproteobacteria bacterium]|nr:GNAT family N-acetyltransferase [Gammaproteobacteria bacterium]
MSPAADARFARGDGDIMIRPLRAEDAPALYAAVQASVASLSYWFPWCSPGYSLADAQARVARCTVTWKRGTEYGFGIFDAGGQGLLGMVGLSDLHDVRRSANLGYWVGERHRGRGVATRAASMVAAIAFGELGLVRLELVMLPHNDASRRVAERLGAVYEETIEGRLVFQGRPAAALVFALRRGQ